MHSESRILLLESVEGAREVGGFGAGGLDREGDDGIRNEHRGLATLHNVSAIISGFMIERAYHGIVGGPVRERITR